ncbi:MAG: hypothetical protein WC082_15395, partial [Victivallales bacterium]
HYRNSHDIGLRGLYFRQHIRALSKRTIHNADVHSGQAQDRRQLGDALRMKEQGMWRMRVKVWIDEYDIGHGRPICCGLGFAPLFSRLLKNCA